MLKNGGGERGLVRANHTDENGVCEVNSSVNAIQIEFQHGAYRKTVFSKLIGLTKRFEFNMISTTRYNY